jgi:hypothetical protein
MSRVLWFLILAMAATVCLGGTEGSLVSGEATAYEGRKEVQHVTLTTDQRDGAFRPNPLVASPEIAAAKPSFGEQRVAVVSHEEIHAMHVQAQALAVPRQVAHLNSTSSHGWDG